MTAEATFTEQDWHELELAPLWVLSAVGGADGKVDKNERAALVDGVTRCAGHSDPFVSRVFASVANHFEVIWAAYMADERFAVHGLEAVETVLSRTAEPAQALHFKQTLVQLGIEVSNASGGVLGLGAKRSDRERKALSSIATALGVPSRRLIAASQAGFESILVALDGSPEAEAALSLARSLAAQFSSRVTLLDVVLEQRPIVAVAPEGFVAPPVLPSAEELRANATAYLESVRSTYGSPEWKIAVVEGAAAEAIVQQATDGGADLIVMATSGSAGLKRLFEGKVTEDVVRLAQVPVLLIPLDDDEF